MDGKLKNQLKLFLVLGRVSNLPTVWSNCLAGWLIAGGKSWGRLGWLCLGATLIYTGGMYLNDAFDVEFDRQHRPERPLPSGKTPLLTVAVLGTVFLISGTVPFFFVGLTPGAVACGLSALVVVYNSVHKHTGLAPVLMGACRVLLYLLAGVVVDPVLHWNLAWRALALGAYITGLSYIARGESKLQAPRWWPICLLSAPFAATLMFTDSDNWTEWVLMGAAASWVAWRLALMYRKSSLPRNTVSGLLAGIVLVDALAASYWKPGSATCFVGLLVVALVLQRVAPAT